VIEHWRAMLRIRRLEEAVVRLAEDTSRPIRGHAHVSIGQEATAAGACAALEPGDYLFTTHRNHGHVLARGGEPKRILAEILGRQDGYSHGRAGGFHIAAPDLGILHTSAIVGGSIALAAGAAFAAQRRKTSRASLVFFGDGAMEEGVVSETLNIAQLWRLPVVLLMENNSVSAAERSGRGSPTSEHAATALSDVPRAYGIRTECIDGTDFEQVLDVAREAVTFTRTENGPFFIEARTSRWPGNYGSAPTLAHGATDVAWTWSPQSAPDPLRHWVESSDPVLRLARDLLERSLVDREQLLHLDNEVRTEMDAAVRFALASPEPDPNLATEFVVAPPR
jgi:pyruvate dehydrogenase E1 component alpha subunit